MSRPIPCRHCGADLEDCGEITVVGYVSQDNDPEGKDKVDLVLNCESCGAEFNAFVALDAFVEVA